MKMRVIIVVKNVLVFLLLPAVFALSDTDKCGREGAKKCISHLMSALTQLRELHKGDKVAVSLEMKMELTKCFLKVQKICGYLGFLDLYNMKDSIDTCDKDGCPDDTAYKALKCLDEYKNMEVACMAQGFTKSLENFIESLDQDLDDLSCNFEKLTSHCLVEMTRDKCGEEAIAYMREELVIAIEKECLSKNSEALS